MSETGETQSSASSGMEPTVQPATVTANGAQPPAQSLVGAQPVPAPLTMENLTFPQDAEMDQDMAKGLLGILNDQNLPPEGRAQALVDMHLKAVESASEAASQFYRDLQDEWVGQALQEFGGEDKLRPMLADIAKLVDKYGGNPAQQAELRDLFSLTGAGNSPRMVGFLHNIAKLLIVEGEPAQGGRPPSEGRSAAEILYPNMARG